MVSKTMKKERESSIELLKIIAVFLIVIAHVIQTLNTKEAFTDLGFSDGFIELTATTDIKTFILIFIRLFGQLGNLIFVVCSSYFLIDSKKDNKKKIIKLWCNTLIISILILGIFLFIGMDISKKTIIKQFFPILFANNWFIAVYIIFIAIIPYLNILINNLDKKQLFRISLVLFLVYYVISFIRPSFQANQLIYFITIYFMITYFKKYMSNFWEKKANCIRVLFLGLVSFILLVIVTDFLGLKFSFMKNTILYWNKMNNPFLLLIAISLFYLFKKLKFRSKFINTVSFLSLYIYLFHENVLIRQYSRVYIWHYLYETIGYKYLLTEIITFSIVLFFVATISSYVYKITVEKIVDRVIEKVEKNKKIQQDYINIEDKILNIK